MWAVLSWLRLLIFHLFCLIPHYSKASTVPGHILGTRNAKGIIHKHLDINGRWRFSKNLIQVAMITACWDGQSQDSSHTSPAHWCGVVQFLEAMGKWLALLQPAATTRIAPAAFLMLLSAVGWATSLAMLLPIFSLSVSGWSWTPVSFPVAGSRVLSVVSYSTWQLLVKSVNKHLIVQSSNSTF